MYAIVRVRGSVNINPKITKTLEIVRLHSVNNMVLMKETKGNRSLLRKIESYATFGEISAETLEKVLEKIL